MAIVKVELEIMSEISSQSQTNWPPSWHGPGCPSAAKHRGLVFPPDSFVKQTLQHLGFNPLSYSKTTNLTSH